MNAQLKQSIKDIIPTQPDPLPNKLIEYVDSLYKLSLIKLPNLPKQAEIGRHHLSAYVAVDQLKNSLDLPEPQVDQIPVPPRLISKVLTDFLQKLEPSTPRKNSVRPLDDNLVSRSNPAKRLQDEASIKDVESPFNPKKKKTMTPFENSLKNSSPLKKQTDSLEHTIEIPATTEDFSPTKNSPFKTPSKQSPFRSPSKSSPLKSPSKSVPGTPSKSKRIVQIPDLIAFANHFYIPADVTPHLLKSFFKLQQKFAKKNEWLLACGMIHTAYIRINHKIMEKKIGARAQLQDQLFQYQKGGLMKPNMIIWCSIVDDMVHTDPWVTNLERQYGSGKQTSQLEDDQRKEYEARLGNEVELDKFGAMVNASMMFTSKSQVKYLKLWTQRVLEKI